MVTERRREPPHSDIRSGGVAARFRPLADVGDEGRTDGDGAAPPVFGTAPWGYRRSEVDSWASWVAALVAHGRNETVRADSAEATLRATLERLEQLQRGADDATAGAGTTGTETAGTGTTGTGTARAGAARPGPPPVSVLPRRIAAVPGAPGADERESGTGDATGSPSGAGSADAPPTRGDDTAGDDRPEMARLQVVDRTLHEVMTLLHRLAGPEKP